MCGICGVITKGQSCLQTTINCLSKLEYRGYDSAGVGFHDSTGTNRALKTVGRISGLNAQVDDLAAHLPEQGSPCIGHTRWATHGVPCIENCHPHTSFGGLINLCHNGIIENHVEIQCLLGDASIELVSETDSECISHVLEECLRNEMLEEPQVLHPQDLCDARVVSAISSALSTLDGSYALVFLLHGDNDRIFGARRDSPLVIGSNPEIHQVFIASDYQAFIDYTNRVTFLEDGDIVVAHSDGSFDIWYDETLENLSAAASPAPVCHQIQLTPPRENPNEYGNVHIVQREEVQVSSDVGLDMAAKGDGDIMLLEINQQPTVVELCLKNRLRPESQNSETMHVELKELILARDRGFSNSTSSIGWNPRRLVFVACGTSLHASIWASYLFRAAGNPRIDLSIASEFPQNPHLMPDLGENVTYFFVSQSGETSDTLRALRKIKAWRDRSGEAGSQVRLLGVCNAIGSSISRETDVCIFTRAGPEVAVASTKAMVSQMITLALISTQLWSGGDSKPHDDDNPTSMTSFHQFLSPVSPSRMKQCVSTLRGGHHALAPMLAALPLLIDGLYPAIQELDKQASAIAELKWMYGAHSCFYVARGREFCLAQEGALKLKEISYIHAEAIPCGELKHGSLALIDSETPSIALLCTSNPVLRNQVRASVQEIKAREGKVIAVCLDDSFADEMNGLVDWVVRIPMITGEGVSQSIVELVFLQLFSYRIAKKLGRNVDKPRNLAKSVTVG